ncbi:MAG: universal stress protein [Bacillota bacterium]|nr:universal stress protein [Bacillota bacterium]
MFKKILVATDGSEGAKKAVHTAVKMLEGTSDVQVTLITVSQPVPLSLYADLQALNIDPMALSEQQAQELLEEESAPLKEAGISFDTQVAVGDPGTEICRVAQEGGYDLIIVGSRGRNQFAEIVLGSVSNRVLHHAGCPVLVVR